MLHHFYRPAQSTSIYSLALWFDHCGYELEGRFLRTPLLLTMVRGEEG
jgi:hypothetical protein